MLGYGKTQKRGKYDEQQQQLSASMVPPQFAERLHSREIKEGQTVRFTVRVTGRPPPDVTWYREGSQIVSSPDFEIIKEGDVHSLYIPEAFYEDSGKFTIRAENPAGTIEDTAELFVEAPAPPIAESATPSPPVSRSPSVGATPERSTRPTIPAATAPPTFSQPLKDQKVREGDRVVLECVFTPYPQPDRVQWFRNQVEVHSSPDCQISVSNGIASMVIVEVFPEDAGEFSCVITISGASARTTMYLHVDAAPPSQPESGPQFDMQLTNQPLSFGQTAYFECKVSGNPPPEILWTRKGHPLVDKQRYKSSYDQYSGITTLTIIGLKEEDEGEYTCTALNSVGETSTTALLLGPDRYADWLRQQQADRDRNQQQNQQRAILSELGTRMESPKPSTPKGFYRPMAEKALDAATESRLSDVEGYPSDSEKPFKVSHFETRLMQEINYREGKVDPNALVTSPPTDKTAFDLQVPVNQALPPKIEQHLKNFQLLEGQDVSFVAKVSGLPTPAIQWFHNGRLLKPGTRYEMKLTKDGYCSLRIRVAFPEDAGYYTLCATNIVGRETTSAELFIEELSKIDDTSYVAPETLRRLTRSEGGSRRGSRDTGGVSEKYYKPVFRKVPADMENREGEMVRFDCIVSGRPMPEIFWYLDGVQVHDDAMHKIVVNESGTFSLIIHSTTRNDAGQYTCIARNRGGEDQFQVHLNVLAREAAAAPRFIERLYNQTLKEGQNAVFTCEATGVPIPMMSWQRDNKMLSSGQRHRIDTEGGRSTLLVQDLRDMDNAWYQCSAVNIAGTASNRARLIVQAEPRKKEPERKLVIPKRTTPTPQREVPQQRAARILPTPDTPTFFDSIRTDSVASSNIDDILPDRITPMDLRDMATPSGTSPLPRPPTRELIKKGVEAAPSEDEMYNRDRPRPPKFKVQLKQQLGLMEAQPARFESRLVPIGDPTMRVEWFKDGNLLDAGHRFKLTNDFGYVALDILYTYAEDNGTYRCVATNSAGRDMVEATLSCRASHPVEPPVDRSMEPAAFQQPLSSLNVEDGKSVRLEATVVGNPPPQVIWFKNGQQLYPSENIKITHENDKAVLVIVQARPADSAVYTCRVMNPAGIAECAADVYVEDKTHAATAQMVLTQQQQFQQQRALQVKKPPPQAPVILKAPSPLREVYAGNTTKIVVQLSAFPEPQFNWYHQGRVVEESQRRKIFYEQGAVTLLIFNVQPQDSGEYLLRARNDQGEVTWKTTLNIQASQKTVELASTQKQAVTIQSTSKTMSTHERTTIIRDVAPSFTHPLPKETTVNERSTARLEVFVDAVPQPRISWHFNGIELKPSIKYTISQENKKSTLLIKNITSQDTGVYTCRAYSELGEAVSSTTVFVIPKEPTLGPEPPKFILPLQSCEAYDGEEVVLTCTVTGRPKPDVDWFHNNKNINRSEDFVISYNRETGKTDCVIVECLPDDQGTFKCVARNEAGQATTEATLQVRPPPPKPQKESAIHPETQIVVQTQMAPQQDSKVVRRQELQIDGENRLDTETVRTTQTKTVTKVVKKSSGEPPRFTKPIQPQVVKEGENIIFTATVAGAPQPEITWLKDKKDMEPSPRIHTTFNPHTMTSTMTITKATQEDIGVYSCRGTNTAGRATCTANAVVVPPDAEVTVTEKTVSVKKEKVTMVGDQETRTVETSPQFVQQLLPQVQAVEGTTVTLEVEINAEPQPDVFWYFNGQELRPSARLEIRYENTRTTLTIRQTVIQDSGEYIIRCVNKLGEVTSRCVVTILSKTAGAVQAPVPPTRVDEAPIQPSGAPAPAQMRPDITSPEVPPAPMNEPCAVIPIRPGQPQGESPKFIVPLRDQTVNDTEKVTFKVIFSAQPTAKVIWFFNGKQIFPSADFQIKTDTLRGESVLFIKEAFPDDEGEFMCKATNKFGTAVTTCHLFVRVPSSSDDEVEKMIEHAVTTKAITLTTQQMAPIVSRSSFSETIGQAHQDRRKEFALTYGIPQLPQLRTSAAKMQVKQVTTTSGATKQMQYLSQPLMQQRRFSETIAIDRARPRQEEVQVEFSLPQIKRQLQKSAILIQQRASLKGMKMEVEITQPRKEYVHYEVVQKKRAEAVGTQRQEMRLELGGATPRFLTQLFSIKVMDGEEVHFSCRVNGLPMPEITWYKNNKVVVDNPDFKTIYNKATGECELFISEVFPQDTGEYRCVAVNQYGKAITSATLTVESYEYVADSEEASASQAESYTKSEDEAEFIERTQAFIANMQKLRAEFQDEEIREEEVEMTEEFHEEVVQMADVKWAIPQKAPVFEAMQTEETTQEVTMEVRMEQSRQEDVVDARVTSRVEAKPLAHVQAMEERIEVATIQEGIQPTVSVEVRPMETQTMTVQMTSVQRKPETLVQAVEEQIDLQLVQEGIQAPVAQEIRQQQQMQVTMETTSVRSTMESHVQETTEQMETQTVYEGIKAPSPQEVAPLQEAQIIMEISQAEAKPMTHVQAVEEQMEPQVVQEGIHAPAPQELYPVQEQPIQVELSTAEAKPMTHVQEAEFQLEPQVVQEGIVAPEPLEIRPFESQQIQVEVSSVEAKPMTHVQVAEYKLDTQQVQEGIQAPITQEVSFTQEGMVTMEMTSVQTKAETRVQEAEFKMEPHIVQEGIVAPVPQEIMPLQEQYIQVEVSSMGAKPMTHVQETEVRLEPQVVQEGIVAPVPQELQPMQEQIFQMQVTSVEQKTTSHVQVQHEQVEAQLVQEGVQTAESVEAQPLQEALAVQEISTVQVKPMTHVQTVEERFEEGLVEEGVQEPVTQEVQPLQEALAITQISAVERKPETHVQPSLESVETFEVGGKISPTADEKIEGEEEMVEAFEVSAFQQKPMTHVQVLEEKMEEHLIQEGIEVAQEETVFEHLEDVSAVGFQIVQDKPLAQVAPVEEQISSEEISETRAMSPQETQTTDIQVALSQGVMETTMSMAAPILEQAMVEQTEEYQGQIPSPESTQEGQVTVQLMRSSIQSPTQSHALTLQEVLPEGAVEEGAIQEIQSEMMQEMMIPEKMVEQAHQQVETQHIGMVEERYSPEEEEDIFFDSFEPGIQGLEMEMRTKIANTRQQATWQTQQQEAFQELTSTEEAHVQYDEERTSPAEVSVSLDKARLEDRKPSFVTIREQVVSPHEAQELPVAQVTEETSQQDLVQVTLDVAGKESPKLSHVVTSEDVVPVDLTHHVEEYTEESTLPEEVHVSMEAVYGQERPETRAPMLAELVPPELVSEDITQSIKEIRMIPSEVQPSYEPAVVERYRFETRVSGQVTSKQEEQADHFLGEQEVAATESRMSPMGAASSTATAQFQTQTQMVQLQVEAAADQPGRASPEEAITLVTGTVEMAAASMEQTTIRAAQEITEERHVITEMVTEEIEVIKKPEVALMAPAFEIPLADTTVTDGEKAYLECTVTGVPVPEVTWFIEGQEIKPSNDFKIFYEDGYCTLEITDCLAEDEGEYSVRAINDAGTCVSTAYLTVLPPSRESPCETPIMEELVAPVDTSAPEAAPKETVVEEAYRKMEVDFTVQARKEVMIEVPIPSGPEAPKFIKSLEHKEIFENMPITLECHVSGQPEPEIVWYQDGKKILHTQHTQLTYQRGVCRLYIDRVTLEDEAEYMCEAKNELGISNSTAEVLVEKLASAVEQVILEEYYDIEIEVYVKWKLPSSYESQQPMLDC